MRGGDEKDQPHIGDSRLPMHENLETEREDDRRPPARSFASESPAPREKQQRGQGRSYTRRESRREIIFAKERVARDLGPINESRFVETIFVVEEWNDVVRSLPHLA